MFTPNPEGSNIMAETLSSFLKSSKKFISISIFIESWSCWLSQTLSHLEHLHTTQMACLLVLDLLRHHLGLKTTTLPVGSISSDVCHKGLMRLETMLITTNKKIPVARVNLIPFQK